MEAQVRQRVNEIRQKQGLSQLRHNEKLAQVARNYSQQMAQKNFFSHTSLRVARWCNESNRQEFSTSWLVRISICVPTCLNPYLRQCEAG
jgi:tRNA G10  N-methylase Trm11